MVPRETARRAETALSAATRCASVNTGFTFCSTALPIGGGTTAGLCFAVAASDAVFPDGFDAFLIIGFLPYSSILILIPGCLLSRPRFREDPSHLSLKRG